MRNLVKAVALVAVVGVAMAAPAQAHHPIVSGEVDCSDNGNQVITWTATNSETVLSDGGNQRTMTLDQAIVSSGALDGFGVGSSFLAQPLLTSTRDGTTTLPGSQTGTVTLSVRADWSGDGPQDVEASTSVTLPGGCQPSATTTTTAVRATTTTTAPSPTTTTNPPTVIEHAELPRTGGPDANVILSLVAAILTGWFLRIKMTHQQQRSSRWKLSQSRF